MPIHCTAVKFIITGLLFFLTGCTFNRKEAIHSPTSLTPLTAAHSLSIQPVWKTTIGPANGFTFTPIVVGGDVYTASANGVLVRLDAATGKSLWRIRTGMPLTAGVGASGAFVAVGAMKGILMVYDAAEGKRLWKAQLSSNIFSSPAVGEGLVVVRTQDNHITAFDVKTGERRWFVDHPAPTLSLHASPGMVIVPQAVLIGLPGGRLMALNTDNGAPWWEVDMGNPSGTTELERISDVVGSPLLEGEIICANAYQGRLGCFHMTTGQTLWRQPFSATAGMGVDASADRLFVVDDQANLSALTLSHGHVVWRNHQLAYRKLGTPVVLSSSVVVGDFEGYLHVLSAADGTLIGRIRLDKSPVLPHPVVTGSLVIFQSSAGTLSAFSVSP